MGTVKDTGTTMRTARQRDVEGKRKEELKAREGPDSERTGGITVRELKESLRELEAVAPVCATCTPDPVRHAIDIDVDRGDYTQRKLSQNLGRDVTDLTQEETWELLKRMQVQRVVPRREQKKGHS